MAITWLLVVTRLLAEIRERGYRESARTAYRDAGCGRTRAGGLGHARHRHERGTVREVLAPLVGDSYCRRGLTQLTRTYITVMRAGEASAAVIRCRSTHDALAQYLRRAAWRRRLQPGRDDRALDAVHVCLPVVDA